MMYDVAFASNLIPLILSVILLRNAEAKDGDIEGQRKGWKTNGNGYLVYKATTSFETTDQITIKGTFSTLPNIGGKNMLIAADDASGYNVFQYWVQNGYHLITIGETAIRKTEMSQEFTGITSGSVYHFTLKLSARFHDDVGYYYNVEISYKGLPSKSLSLGRNAKKDAWNLKNVTFFIGGYNLTSENYFHGCLSNFVFDGIDIVENYFDQYPNNLNPSKGLLEIGDFSSQPENCEDLTTTSIVAPTTNPTIETNTASTVAPTTHPTIETNTTENASLRPQSMNCVMLFLFVFTILISRNIV